MFRKKNTIYLILVVLDGQTFALESHVSHDARVNVGHVDVLVVRRRVVGRLQEAAVDAGNVPARRYHPRLAERGLVRLVDVGLELDLVVRDGLGRDVYVEVELDDAADRHPILQGVRLLELDLGKYVLQKKRKINIKRFDISFQ